MSETVYAEQSWNPLARTVELTEGGLKVGSRTTPPAELHMVAMADAYLRGQWLGGGGSERPFAHFPSGTGIVPVTRITGSTKPVKARRAAEFAQFLGDMAVRHAGGPAAVSALADRARAEGVPLWMARRFADGPGGPVTVAVDRRSVRVDVWSPSAPVVRIRAPHGVSADRRDTSRGLLLTVGEAPAMLAATSAVRKSKRSVVVELPQRRWELTRENARTSRLTCNGRLVALLTRPLPGAAMPGAAMPGTALLPLADVRHDSPEPLDAVMAHTFAVAFGLGDATGTVRFRARRTASADEPVWDQPWFTNLGSGSDDNGSGGGAGDGWDAGSGGGDGGGGGGDGGGGGGGGD
ncbi:hypothetical protein [Streptomyces sp. NBC_00286]|uniref:hypothetical protein n=1 Tax=Streptomyces sp. NBC_00286 TaxID=2975701 RepID=UPI002E2A1DF6|nr:hypothetical protein [Streptomyces sp. NBC_00286]